MTPLELIDKYQDACEATFKERPNIQYRYGHFYRIDGSTPIPIQRSTLERVAAAWGPR